MSKKFKINVIAHQLKNKRVAKFGDIVDVTELTSSSEVLVNKGFILKATKKEVDAAEAKKEAAKKGNKAKDNQGGNPAAEAKKRKDEILQLKTVDEVKAALKDETAPSVKKAGLLRISLIELAADVQKRKDVFATLETVDAVNAALKDEKDESVKKAGLLRIAELTPGTGE